MYKLKHNLNDEVSFMSWSNPTPIKDEFGTFTMQRIQVKTTGIIKEIQITNESIKYLIKKNDNLLELINANEIL